MKFTKMQGCGNDYVYINGFEEKIEQENLYYLYYDVENKLSSVLFEMEEAGFKIDENVLDELKWTYSHSSSGWLFRAYTFMDIAFSPCGRRTSFRVPFFQHKFP